MDLPECLPIAPLADGSLHPADVEALKEIGRRIKTQGLPQPACREELV